MIRSKSTWFLIVWFGWLAGKQLDAIVRFPTTSDYYVFSSIETPWLFFVLGVPVFALSIGALYSLFRPHPKGIHIIYNAIAAGVLQVVVTATIALRDLEGVREAYVVGREYRGWPIRQETANQLFSENGMLMVVSVFLFLNLIVAYYTHRSREYLFGDTYEINE